MCIFTCNVKNLLTSTAFELFSICLPFLMYHPARERISGIFCLPCTDHEIRHSHKFKLAKQAGALRRVHPKPNPKNIVYTPTSINETF